MSRSVKKNPISKENRRGSNKKNKQIANSTIRAKEKQALENEAEHLEIGDGNEYKKHYDSWNISEFKFRKTEDEALEEYRRESDPNDIKYDPRLKEFYPTEKAFLRWWRKFYKNK